MNEKKEEKKGAELAFYLVEEILPTLDRNEAKSRLIAQALEAVINENRITQNFVVKEISKITKLPKKDLIAEFSDIKKNKGIKEKPIEKDTEKNISFLEDDKVLIEQVIIDGISKFAVYFGEGEEVEYVDLWEKEGITYYPFNSEEVEKKIIGLPTGIKEYGSDAELHKDLNDFVFKWLDIDDAYRKFAIYNILKSWVYQRFHTLNYLRALGEYGTGKSRFLDTLGYLHYKPIATSGALTGAVMFRLIEKWRGTLIVDEADRSRSDESDEVIKIINQGYEKGRNVIRCDKDKNYDLTFFDTYCPKILATRKQFEDKATESRCITTIMKSTSRKDIIVNLNEDFQRELGVLRNKLLLWRFRNYWKIDSEAGLNIDLDFLEPRLRQVSTGFFAMFADNTDAVEEFKDFLREHQKELTEQRAMTSEGKVINAIFELVMEHLNTYPTKKFNQEMLNDLTINSSMLVERSGLTNKQGKTYTPQKMGSIMKNLGFGKAQIRRNGASIIKCYEFDITYLTSMFNKYVSEEDRLGVIVKND